MYKQQLGKEKCDEEDNQNSVRSDCRKRFIPEFKR